MKEEGTLQGQKAIVLLSGGMDSTTALYWAKREGAEIYALSIDYYWRHEKEKEAVKKITMQAGVRLVEADLPFMMDITDLKYHKFPVPNLNNAPEGYQPQKNLLFTGMAFYYAEALGADAILSGNIQSDGALYPDATPEYFSLLEKMGNLGMASKPRTLVKLVMPLLGLTKMGVLRLALELGVPLESTWSCYDVGTKPCGVCKACKERASAFHAFKIKDPILYFQEKGLKRGISKS